MSSTLTRAGTVPQAAAADSGANNDTESADGVDDNAEVNPARLLYLHRSIVECRHISALNEFRPPRPVLLLVSPKPQR